MGTIELEIEPGNFVPFEIKGEEPTFSEMMQAKKLVRKSEMESREGTISPKDSSQFDTTTGIKNNKLRRQLGGAENAKEEENILANFGFREGDYVRDARGNLAITPQGALLLDIKTDKPIVIDESGFSISDLQDFVGAAGQEIVGGVAGAIAGQALIPVPILGAMIGAGIGSGGGKLVEEGVETIRGTQEESLTKVGTDALKEAAIAAAGEGIFGLAFKGFGSLAGRGRVGNRLAPETQTEVAEAIESNYKPSLSAMGANSLIARQQGIGEKALGTSKRLRENHEQIMKDLDKFKAYGTDGVVDVDATAAILTNAVEAGDNSLLKAEKLASNNLIQHMDDIATQFGKVAKKDGDLNADIQSSFVNAYKAFDDKVKEKYANIENLTNSALGDTALFNTRGLKDSAQLELDRLIAARSGNLGKSREAVDELMKLPDDASFTQVYKARKNLNDKWMVNYGSDSVRLMKDRFLNKLDDFISPKAIDNLTGGYKEGFIGPLRSEGLSIAEINLMKKVAAEIPEVRKFFKLGMNKFEKISAASSLKSLKASVKGDKELNPSQAFKNLIRLDNPKLLKDARAALGNKVYEPLRERAAGEWLRVAMRESGSTLDSTRKFSGSKLKDKLDSLGGTADELFGPRITEIRKLADQLDSLSLTRIDQSVIEGFVRAGGDDAGIDLLKEVKKAMKDKAEFDSAAIVRKLRAGSLMPDEAADLLANPSVKGNDITKVSEFFKKKPEELAELQGYYMQNLIGDFEHTFMTDKKSFKLLADRLVKSEKSGKLRALFPKEQADAIAKFGRNMKVLGASADGGDLVAANIAANPLENLGTIARLSIVGNLLSTGPFYTSFAAKYGKEAAKQKTKAGKMQVFLNILNESTKSFVKQEGMREAVGVVSDAKKQSRETLGNIKNKVLNSSSNQTNIPIPEVSPVFNTSENQSALLQPPTSVRDRAKNDSQLASILLGGIGNSAFL